ncbi:MAG: class I SAM-dependent methyltransferase [Armatimonadetes bacterium]|nr:class I SAM-dependent methyltransferase [Armatimonadota bacterium]
MQTEEYGKMRQAEDHYWWFVSRRRLALALLDRYASSKERILDVASGTGAVLTELQKLGWAGGIDFSPLAVKYCLERHLPNLMVGNAEAVPVQSGTIDVVVSLDTLEHVAADEAAVSEFARVLRPGGVIILNVPAFKWLWGPHDVALMHHRRYTKRQIRDLLERHGFKMEKLSYSVFLLFPVVVLIRWLDKFRWGPAKVSLPNVSGRFNSFLVKLQDMETRWIMARSLPWGSSVVAVARKED